MSDVGLRISCCSFLQYGNSIVAIQRLSIAADHCIPALPYEACVLPPNAGRPLVGTVLIANLLMTSVFVIEYRLKYVELCILTRNCSVFSCH